MTDNTPTTKQEEGGLEQSPTDEAFADAVWAALKGDHNDLRRQAIILRAHRAAAPATPPDNEDGLRKLAERLHQAADDIVSGETIFSDRVHGLLWEAADALSRQVLGDIPSG